MLCLPDCFLGTESFLAPSDGGGADGAAGFVMVVFCGDTVAAHSARDFGVSGVVTAVTEACDFSESACVADGLVAEAFAGSTKPKFSYAYHFPHQQSLRERKLRWNTKLVYALNSR